MIRFLIDAQLPPALRSWIEDKGYAAEHISTVLGGQTPDRVIASHAAAEGWTLITKDDDFRFRFPPIDYQLVWLRCGNITNVGLRTWLEPRWPAVTARLVEGEMLVEVR